MTDYDIFMLKAGKNYRSSGMGNYTNLKRVIPAGRFTSAAKLNQALKIFLKSDRMNKNSAPDYILQNS